MTIAVLRRFMAATVVVACLAPISAQPSKVDLLIRGGHVIDPRNGIDRPMDVAIAAGKIVNVASTIDPAGAARVVDATDLYVVPGLFDIHAHGPSPTPI